MIIDDYLVPKQKHDNALKGSVDALIGGGLTDIAWEIAQLATGQSGLGEC